MRKAHLLAVVLVLCGPAAIAATESDDPFESGGHQVRDETKVDRSRFERNFTGAIRLQAPLAGLVGTSRQGGVGGLAVLGASVGLRAFSWVEVELAGTLVAAICQEGSARILRVGVAPSVLQPSVEGTRWNLRIPALVSYVRYSGRSSGCDDPEDRTNDVHAYLFSTGFEATRWIKTGRIGFDMRTLIGIGGGKETNETVGGWGDAGRVTELSMSFGVLFQ